MDNNKQEIKKALEELNSDIEYDKNKLLKSINRSVINEILDSAEKPPKKLGFFKKLMFILSGK